MQIKSMIWNVVQFLFGMGLITLGVLIPSYLNHLDEIGTVHILVVVVGMFGFVCLPLAGSIIGMIAHSNFMRTAKGEQNEH